MILPKIRVLHSHGRQAIPDLDAVELTPEFRGRPCLTETRDADAAEIEARKKQYEYYRDNLLSFTPAD